MFDTDIDCSTVVAVPPACYELCVSKTDLNISMNASTVLTC